MPALPALEIQCERGTGLGVWLPEEFECQLIIRPGPKPDIAPAVLNAGIYLVAGKALIDGIIAPGRMLCIQMACL